MVTNHCISKQPSDYCICGHTRGMHQAGEIDGACIMCGCDTFGSLMPKHQLILTPTAEKRRSPFDKDTK